MHGRWAGVWLYSPLIPHLESLNGIGVVLEPWWYLGLKLIDGV